LNTNVASRRCFGPDNPNDERLRLRARTVMTRIFRLLAALLITLAVIAPAMAGPASPVGRWEQTTGQARYSVAACGKGGALLCAKLVWIAPSERTDENMAKLNTYVVKGAAPVSDNKWSGNVVVDGQTYEGTMTLVSRNYMKLKGCAGILCQTFEFTRI
jgi:uncharacterized protein (DUF2147 family)